MRRLQEGEKRACFGNVYCWRREGREGGRITSPSIKRTRMLERIEEGEEEEEGEEREERGEKKVEIFSAFCFKREREKRKLQDCS